MNTDFIKCFFCANKDSEEYIYTECNHLVCLACASLQWDKKYSIKCSNKTTFLQEETCFILNRINKEQQILKNEIKQQVQVIQNIDKFTPMSMQISKVIQVDNSLCMRRPRQLQHKPILMEQKQNKSQLMPFIEKQTELNLQRIQKVLNENLKKVKQAFEFHHKELQRKEQNLLKSVYNKYSHHLNSIKDKIQEDDIHQLNTKLNQLLNDELLSLNNSQHDTKDDRILNKLEYNHLRMKEKINRHYDLLK